MKELAPNPIQFFGVLSSPPGREPSSEVTDIARGALTALKGAYEEIAAGGGAAPGQFPEWDTAAFKRLEAKLGPCRCAEADHTEVCPLEPYMLMYHESDRRTAFKHADTRRYIFA